MTVRLWRIASDTPDWAAEDLSGKGAALRGARWNHPGQAVAYAATSVSLAAWETRAHLGPLGTAMPWNRFLVRIDVPDAVWSRRHSLARPLPVGWNAIPEGGVARALGARWLGAGTSALLLVPSVVIEEEDNVLIAPSHQDARSIVALKVRRFVYDPRV